MRYLLRPPWGTNLNKIETPTHKKQIYEAALQSHEAGFKLFVTTSCLNLVQSAQASYTLPLQSVPDPYHHVSSLYGMNINSKHAPIDSLPGFNGNQLKLSFISKLNIATKAG